MSLTRTLLLVAFLVSAAVVSCRMGPQHFASADPNLWRWLPMALALVSTIAAEIRDLPAQNVILAASVIGAAGAVGATSSKLVTAGLMDQGHFPAIGKAVFESDLLATTGMWVVMILNARGVAKVLLHPWRHTPKYGLCVLLSSASLIMALEGVSALATNQQATANTAHPFNIRSANPWIHVTTWTVMTFVTLAIATPLLIDKSFVHRKPKFQPLFISLALYLMPLANAAVYGAWLALGFLGGASLLILVYGVRNWFWQIPNKSRNELKQNGA